MQDAKTATAAEVLQAVYKNLKMAQDSLLTLMPKVADADLKKDMTVQLSALEAFASRSAKLLSQEGAKPEEEGFFTRMSAKWGSMMNTMKDSSGTHLAEMLIEGYTMGVNDLYEQKRALEAGVADRNPDVRKLVDDVCAYQERLVSDLKKYLK